MLLFAFLCWAYIFVSFLAVICWTLQFHGQDRIRDHEYWQLICLFYSSVFYNYIYCALFWFISKTWKTYKIMFCGLSRNNTENTAVIFGEENQFCIAYFNVNNTWILLVKKKKILDCKAHIYTSCSMTEVLISNLSIHSTHLQS